MMKKILSCLVCAAVVLSLAGCGSENPLASDAPDILTSNANTSAASKPDLWSNIPEISVTAEDAFKYEYNSDMGGMVITDYLKESPKVRIPDTLEGEPVVGVDLSKCEKQITELVMPDTVLGWGLSDTIKEHLQYIGLPVGSFDYDVESKVPGFSDHFGSFGTSYGYGDSYGESADYNAEIEEAFYSLLLEMSINEFGRCYELKAMGIGEKSPRFACYDGMMYYEYKGDIMFVFCPRGKTGDVTIPKDVTVICPRAFSNCDKLTSITIPNSVTEIENNIFEGCENISVTYKGKTYDYAHIGEFYDLLMYGDSMVNGVKVENGKITAVSPNATAVIIPDNITEVDENLFYKCPKLETIQYKNKTYYWSDRNDRDKLLAVFRGEEGLTIENGVLTAVDPNLTEIKIPDRVTGIMRDAINFPLAFQQCDKLKKVTFGNGISSIKGNYMLQPFMFTSIFGEYYENGCGVEEVIIPEGVTEVGDSAFAELTKLRTVKLPNSLTSIGIGAFLDCESLKNITIPESVTSIAAPTKSDTVTGLGHTLPGSPGAFDGCTNIKATYKGKTYDYAHIDDLYKAINGNNTSAASGNSTPSASGTTTSVSSSATPANSSSRPQSSSSRPQSSSSKPQSSTTSSSSSITPVDINVEGLTIIDGVLVKASSDLSEVKIPDGVTEISERAFANNTVIKSVTIPGSVKKIGANAFNSCSNLQSVTILKGVTEIGDFAFSYCTSLKSITIPDGVKSIGAGAFGRCILLQSVSVPDSVNKIGGSAFEFCTSLKSITVPKGVTEIANGVFSECTSLQSVTIPNGVTEVCDNAFFNCKSLKSITIPNGATKIGVQAFSNCTNLQSVTIPNSVTEIGVNAFNNCTNLQSIKLPTGITMIYKQVFNNCTSLQSVTIPNGVTMIGERAFFNCTSLKSVTIPDSVVKLDVTAFGGSEHTFTYKGQTYDLAHYNDLLKAINGN